MSKIFFHADDFGVTVEQSKSILDCYYNGVLNSVSIIANSTETAESYKLIKNLVDENKIRLVIHLNFVEGPCLSNASSIPNLVNEKGYFNCSYGRILKLNYSNKKTIVKEEFKNEIAAQIKAIVDLTGSKTINVDSHQHYLQIPMIFDALCEVIQDNGYTLDYLRIPVDPLSPTWSSPSLFFKIPIINHVKWSLLKFLSPSKSKLASLNAKVPTFFGMPFTCQMTYDKVTPLIPKYLKIANKHSTDLELMFHPGAVHESSKLLDSSQSDLVEFYSATLRDQEYKALIKLKETYK